jgi:Kae1-associated kinase Bud32
MKTIAKGAEAIIKKERNLVVKDRIKKPYRLPELDEKLRKSRTKKEAKLMEKANSLVPSPKIIAVDEKTKTISMQFIPGKKLASSLDKMKNRVEVCAQIGSSLAKLHDAGMIHGDLTTSNLIYNEKEKKVYFIDFGLGFHSDKIEDKAVDLHLIKEALEAKHSGIFESAFSSVLKGYKKSANYKKTIAQLEKVEKRGRYKQQY